MCEVRLGCAEYTSFSLLMNKVPALLKISVRNLTGEELTDLTLVIRSDSGLMEEYEEPVKRLGPGKTIRLVPDKIPYRHNYLASLEGRTEENIRITVQKDGRTAGEGGGDLDGRSAMSGPLTGGMTARAFFPVSGTGSPP